MSNAVQRASRTRRAARRHKAVSNSRRSSIPHYIERLPGFPRTRTSIHHAAETCATSRSPHSSPPGRGSFRVPRFSSAHRLPPRTGKTMGILPRHPAGVQRWSGRGAAPREMAATTPPAAFTCPKPAYNGVPRPACPAMPTPPASQAGMPRSRLSTRLPPSALQMRPTSDAHCRFAITTRCGPCHCGASGRTSPR